MKFAVETFKAGEDLLKCLQAALGTGGPFTDLSFCPERWSAIAALAAKAGLSPILFRGLPIADPILGIPRHVKSSWLHEYLASETKNDILYKHLEIILAVFNREGIPVILLKGIHLMDSLYPERGMRTVGDIDFLVHSEDKKRSMRIMDEFGFALITSPHISDPVHCAYECLQSGVIIEVHFDISSGTPQRLDIEGFWERSELVKVNNQFARVLGPEDLIIHLSLHLTRHLLDVMLFPASIRSLYDIALLIQQKSHHMDWGKVMDALRHAQGEKQFVIPIMLVEKLLDVSPPQSLVERFDDAKSIPPADIDILKTHILLSCERDQMDARMPKFLRSSVMASKTNIVLGFFKRVFVSRAELARRYGSSPHWYLAYRKYLQHFQMLIKVNFRNKRWKLGRDTMSLASYYKEIAAVRDRINLGK